MTAHSHATAPTQFVELIYPDSSRGAQFQHADLFLKHAIMFLNA
jgi:hypothetical protein